jgi:hypothetical protein
MNILKVNDQSNKHGISYLRSYIGGGGYPHPL